MNPLIAAPHGTALSVNVNKVALLRNTRHLGIPSVMRAATLCLEAGAQGITVHPRPDERHIRASDVHELAALMRQLARRRVQPRRQPLPQPDGTRARAAPAPSHLRARFGRAVHLRSRLALPAGCGASCARSSPKSKPWACASACSWIPIRRPCRLPRCWR